MDKDIGAIQILFTEVYYWVTVVFMFLIHVGFCTYEVGVSRRKNHLATLMKNAMVIPIVGVTFYLFGWWFYSAMVNGPGITGGLVAAPFAEPWNELMAPHMGGKPVDPNLTAGRYRALGAAQRRVLGGLPAVLLDHRLDRLGLDHRAREVGRVLADRGHARLGDLDHRRGLGLAPRRLDGARSSAITTPMPRAWCMPSPAAPCLAVLINLGPRIGKFRADGTPRNIPPQNPWLVCIGLFLIYTGFWGFYAACNIPIYDVQAGDGVFWSATNIYLQATTLSGDHLQLHHVALAAA